MRTSLVHALVEPIKKGNGTIKLTIGALVALAATGAGYGKLVDDVGDNSTAIVEIRRETAEDLNKLEEGMERRLERIEDKLDALLSR